MRSHRGQASVDYLAVLGLVAAVLAIGASAVGAPWLAPRLAQAIRHGICVVSGSLCTPEEARRAGADPCVVHRVRRSERLGATAVVRLGRGDTLLVERRSDGSVAVSFVDGVEAGAEIGLGVKLPVATASAVAGGGIRFASGRAYEFGDWPSAQRFLARFASQEALGGEARRALRALCLRCPAWLEGTDPRPLPPPTARFHEGGAYGDLTARLGLRVPGSRSSLGLSGRAEALRMLGRRTQGRRTTYSLRLDGTATVQLGAVVGSLASTRGQEGVLEVTLDDGRLVDVRARVAIAVAAEGGLEGSRLDLGRLADRLRAVSAAPPQEGQGGMAVEVSAGLDLREPEDRLAVEALLSPGLSPQGWLERVRAFGRRLDSAGRVDLQVSRAQEDQRSYEAGVGAAAHFGAGYHRSQQTRELVAAWSLRAGQLRRREDCEAAALAAGGAAAAS